MDGTKKKLLWSLSVKLVYQVFFSPFIKFPAFQPDLALPAGRLFIVAQEQLRASARC